MSDKTNMEQLLEWAETSQNFKEKISIIDKIKQFIEKEKQVKNNDFLDNVSVSALEFKAALTLIRDLIDLKNVGVICKKDWNEIIKSSKDFLEQHSLLTV